MPESTKTPTLAERLEAAEARLDALEEFREVLVKHDVGGPELQRALRDIDRRAVKRARARKAKN